jgi:nucleoid-associated protein YgaU
MSIRRLVATAAAMALIAGALSALTPGLSSMAGTLASAQRTVDTAGPDVLVMSAAGLLAWAVWGWGALGLALTAASALPGLLGGAARRALHVVLPAGARRGAALALGLGLGVAGPLLGTATLLTPTPASATDFSPPSTAGAALDWPVAPTAVPVPDWPATTAGHQPGPAPDWPAMSPAEGTHVVVRGECLWHIASDRLLGQHGRMPTDGEVAAATQAWWQANADVIGPDPDRLLPGQVLSPPDPP